MEPHDRPDASAPEIAPCDEGGDAPCWLHLFEDTEEVEDDGDEPIGGSADTS